MEWNSKEPLSYYYILHFMRQGFPVALTGIKLGV